MNDELEVKIDLSKYTPTELITETQRLHFRDPEINRHMVATLHKIANGIENGKVAITRLRTEVDLQSRELPTATFEFDFIDFEHESKSNPSKRRQTK